MSERLDGGVIRDLLQTERGIIAAYDAALDNIGDPHLGQALRKFRDQHHNHAERLRAVLDGAAPGRAPDAEQDVSQGGGELSDERDTTRILEALRLDEADLAGAYEQSLDSPELPTAARALIEDLLAQERRHESAVGALLDEGRRQPGVERSGPGDTGSRR